MHESNALRTPHKQSQNKQKSIFVPSFSVLLFRPTTHTHTCAFDQYRGLDVSRNYNADALSPEQMIGGNGGVMGANPQQQQTVQQMQQGGGGGNGVGTQRISSATPTMQQRIKALGVATPLALSSPVRR